MVLKGAELHHKIQYTDKFRGLYSPPFDTVTEDLWSIIILYIDSRFLYTQKEPKKRHILMILKNAFLIVSVIFFQNRKSFLSKYLLKIILLYFEVRCN